jgi:hypothetical protein
MTQDAAWKSPQFIEDCLLHRYTFYSKNGQNSEQPNFDVKEARVRDSHRDVRSNGWLSVFQFWWEPFYRSLDWHKHTSEHRSSPLYLSVLSYFASNLLPNRDMTWEFYLTVICVTYWNKSLMSYLYSVINLM